MNVAVFGSFGRRMLAPGWIRQTALAFLGGGELDLSGVDPAAGAQLTAIAIFGGIDVIADEGSQVTMDGFGLFGSRDVEIVPSTGPRLHIRADAIFGSVEVKSPTSWLDSPSPEPSRRVGTNALFTRAGRSYNPN